MLKPLLCFLLGFQVTTGTLEVTVHVAGTTTPLAGVELTLNGVSRQKTDESGRAVFSNLATGMYRVQAERSGYFRKDESLPSIYELPSSVMVRMATSTMEGLAANISSANWNQRISIGMLAFGSIKGRVTDKNGAPLKDVYVSAGSIHYQNGRRVLDEWTRLRSDSKGEYHLISLGPGEYYVRAEQPNVESGYAATYYPGEADIQRATWITVRSGDQIGGIDFVGAKPATFSISGKVLNIPKRTLPDGRIVSANIQFVLLRDPGVPDFWVPVRLPNGRSVPEGEFFISGIPAGSWELLSVTEGLVSTLELPRIIGRVQVVVVDDDVHDVVITGESYSVIGRTRMHEGGIVPIALRGMLVPRDNTPPSLLNRLTEARTLGILEGKFEFENVPPGKYSFQFEAVPAGYYLADIRQGARSIYDDGIIEVGSQPPEPLEIVMGRGGGRLNGKVEGLPEKANTQEYGSTRVVLIPAKRRNLMLYQVTSLSSDGRFSFFYLAPGEYKIFALKNLPTGAQRSSEFLRRYEALGTSVSISSDSVDKEILVPLIRND